MDIGWTPCFEEQAVGVKLETIGETFGGIIDPGAGRFGKSCRIGSDFDCRGIVEKLFAEKFCDIA